MEGRAALTSALHSPTQPRHAFDRSTDALHSVLTVLCAQTLFGASLNAESTSQLSFLDYSASVSKRTLAAGGAAKASSTTTRHGASTTSAR